MIKQLTKFILMYLLVANFTSYAYAQDDLSRERFLRMQNTIDELTDRVSTLKKENKRLEEKVRAALQSSKTNTPLKVGCDVHEVEKSIAFEGSSTNQKSIFMNWIKKNGETCTTGQLRRLQTVANGLLYSDAPKRAVSFLLSN